MKKLLKKLTILEIAVIFLLSSTLVYALEAVRQKNVATQIRFPMTYINGTLVTGAADLDSEISYLDTENATPSNFTDCSDEAVEIQSSGQYFLNLTAAETNHLYAYVQVKTSTANATTQVIPILLAVGNPHNLATTDDGGTINVTTGAIDTVTTTATATAVTTLNGIANFVITAVSINADAITAAKIANGAIDAATFASGAIDATAIATDAIGAAEIAAGAGTEIGTAVWATAARALTDKAGFALADSTSDAVIADAVWNAATASYGSAGTYGLLLETDLDAAITSRATAATVWTYGVRSVTGGSIDTNLDKTGYTVSTVSDKTGYALSAAGVDTIWDEAASGHTTTGTFGKYLDKQLTTFNDLATAGVASAVWNAATASYGTTGTYGLLLETDLDAAISSRGTSTLTASDNIGINWADITNPTTAQNLSGTNIKTDQVVASVSGAVGSVTGNVGGNVAGSVASVTGGVTVTTNNDKTGYTASTVSDKTGYSLTQAFPTNFSSLAISGVGAVTAGTVSDKTGYSLSQAFPTNFSSLAISALGKVTIGTNDDKTGYSISGTKTTLDSLNDVSASGFWNLDISGYSGAKAGTYLKTLYDNWTSTRAGYIDKLNVTGALANTDNAASFKADVSGLSTFDPATDMVLVGGYDTNESPADYVLETPANKLATDEDGKVTISNPGTTVY